MLAIKKVEWEATQDLPKLLPEPNWDEVETKLSPELTSHIRNIHRENALIIISCRLLYWDFQDAYYKGYSGRIEKCIEMFAILFQGINYKNYVVEMIRLIAYLKYI